MQKTSDMLKKQLENAKFSIKNLLHNKLFYVYLTSFIFVFLSIFFEKAPIYLCAYILFFVCILNMQDAISMLLFFYPFFSIFVTKKQVNLYFYLFAVSLVIFAIKYLVDVFTKKKKIDWVLVVAVCVYLLYLVLPLHKNEQGKFVNFCNLKYFASVGVFLLAVYLIFIYKDKLDGAKIFKVFMAGFLIAGVMGVFVFCSPRLKSVLDLLTYKIPRYNALFQVPNTLAIISLVASSITLYLHYNEKIKSEAYLFFAGSFVLGYLTMARSFLYPETILFVLYLIFTCIKYKKESWKIVLPYVAIIIVVALAFFKYTLAHLERFGFKDLLKGYGNSVDASDAELNQMIDPGRGGLIKKYGKDYLSSALVILFGRGIAYPWMSLSSHNTYLQCLWNTGLVGLVLIIALFVLFLKKYCAKKSKELVKSIFTNVSLYMLLLPILAMAFVENLFMNMQMIVTILLVIFAVLNNKDLKNSKETISQNELDEQETEEEKIKETESLKEETKHCAEEPETVTSENEQKTILQKNAKNK